MVLSFLREGMIKSNYLPLYSKASTKLKMLTYDTKFSVIYYSFEERQRCSKNVSNRRKSTKKKKKVTHFKAINLIAQFHYHYQSAPLEIGQHK